MSQGTPDPNSRDRDFLSRYSLDYDEMIALLVAFLTLGSVFFWGLSRSGWDWLGGESLLSTGEAALQGTADEIETRLGAGRSGRDDGDGAVRQQDEAVAAGGAAGVLRDDEASDSPDQRRRSSAASSDAVPGSNARSFDATRPADGAGSGIVLPRQAAQPAAPDAATPNTVEPSPAPATPLEPSQEAISFLDMPEDYWAKPFVDALSSRGLIAGFDDGTFKPDAPVTRAQLAQVINSAFDLSSEEAVTDFTDVAADYWAFGAIQDAVKGGFMNGFPNASFQPDVSVPRVQVLTALVTGLQTEAAGDVSADVDRYIDAAKIPDWAVGKVAAATQSGLVVNYPELNQLAPNQPATRAEVAAMVYQALVYQGRIEPVASEYLVQP